MASKTEDVDVEGFVFASMESKLIGKEVVIKVVILFSSVLLLPTLF
jgi:hypothetical protein